MLRHARTLARFAALASLILQDYWGIARGVARLGSGERMNLDGNSLLAGFAVSTVSFGFFMYGKKQARPPQLLFGLIGMVYPYFVGSPGWVFGIFGLLLGSLYLALRLGW